MTTPDGFPMNVARTHPVLPAASLDPRVVTLLRRAVAGLEAAQIPYAVGGGVAVNAHGFAYQTHDIDIFFRPDAQHEALRALHTAGLTVSPVFEPFHYAVHAGARQGPIRIDAMFPADDPELSAVEMAVPVRVGRTTFRAFPVDLLVVAKFLADRPGKDRAHVAQMHRLGLFDPARVHWLLTQIEPGSVRAWQAFLRRSSTSGDRAHAARGWRRRRGDGRKCRRNGLVHQRG